MSPRRYLIFGILSLAMTVFLFAGGVAGHDNGATSKPTASASSGKQDEAPLRFQGERRFRANCGRCHQAPHKFPPRMMATIIRHMRVRATVTDEDMRLILQYMTQ